MVFEGWSFSDALYMTVITLTTVGYREVRTLDTTGQLWTMVLLITGVGTLFYAAVSSVELVVEGTIRGYFGRRRMQAAIGKLSGHYILCGYGRVGRQVAAEFARDGVPFVVIDQDPEIVEACAAEGHLALLGEASDDGVLYEAGVRRAKGLVAAVDSDADNVFVVLSARKLNPKLHIVARASSDESAAKLEMAGAERTLSPYAVGGRRLASLATQPLIVDFLDIVTRGEKGIEFRLEEFDVPGGLVHIRPHHRRAQDRGEDRGHDPRHPQQGRHLRHHPFRQRPPPGWRHPHRPGHPRADRTPGATHAWQGAAVRLFPATTATSRLGCMLLYSDLLRRSSQNSSSTHFVNEGGRKQTPPLFLGTRVQPDWRQERRG